MLFCDGYVPWTVFVRRFAIELEKRMSAWAEQPGTMIADGAGQGWPSSMNLAFKNCRAAAQSLALLDARRRGGAVRIMTPTGFMPSISVLQFKTDYYFGSLKRDKGDRQTWTVNTGNPKLYAGNDWQQPFATQEIFRPRHHYERGIMDWKSGSINIASAVREARYRATSALRRTAEHLTDSDSLKGMIAVPDDVMDAEPIAVFRPYHGNPVVVPRSWIEDSPLSYYRAEPTDEFDDLPPADRILALLEENPAMNKAEVKEALFPSASERRFLAYWESAALAKPEISRPGRKRVRV